MPTISYRMQWLLLVVAFVAVGMAALASSSGEQNGAADSRRMRQLQAMSKRQLVNRVNYLESIFKCVRDTIKMIFQGNFGLAQTCCSIPILNQFCRRQFNDQSPDYD